MEKPYICIAGKNNIAVEVLNYILQHYEGYSVCIVCNKTETGENTFQRSLRRFAWQNGIEEKTLDDVYEIDDLIFLSLEFDRIIKPHLFKDARLYNIHFSMLPKYKGMYTSAHPILNGEKHTGVTLHKIDAGIDTGDIIDQEQFEINSDDDCRAVYLQYIECGINIVLRNIDDLIANKVMAKAQSTELSSYYSKKSIDYSNLYIDLNKTANEIGSQIRAFSFREYQLAQVYGEKIIDYRILPYKACSKPGTILIKGKSYFIISTIDNNMVLYFDRFDELMDACENGNIELVIDICSVRKHVNVQDENGWSPLIKATYYNQIDVVKYLISLGADIKMVNRNGTNLLMYAKEAYKRSRDNTLFKLFYSMGLSVKQNDYEGHNVLYYLKKDGISFEEIRR